MENNKIVWYTNKTKEEIWESLGGDWKEVRDSCYTDGKSLLYLNPGEDIKGYKFSLVLVDEVINMRPSLDYLDDIIYHFSDNSFNEGED